MKKVELPVENILYKVCFSSSFFPFSFFPLLSPFFSISISSPERFYDFFPCAICSIRLLLPWDKERAHFAGFGCATEKNPWRSHPAGP